MSRSADAAGALRGLQKVWQCMVDQQVCEASKQWSNSSLRVLAEDGCNKMYNSATANMQKSEQTLVRRTLLRYITQKNIVKNNDL